METWWQGLGVLNKGFALAAVFFSVVFIWQLILMIIGLDADSHAGAVPHDVSFGGADADHGMAHHDGGPQGGHEGVAFTLVSFRSMVAFGTLFTWAGTLYLMTGTSAPLAIVYSFCWGLAALFSVSGLLYALLRLQETGTATIWSAVGEQGSVYMDIPADGLGKVRVLVSGVLSFVNARGPEGVPLPAGTRVTVTRIVNDTTVEVRPIDGI